MRQVTVYGLAIVPQLGRELVCELRGHRGRPICTRCGTILDVELLQVWAAAGRRIAAAFNRMTKSAELGRQFGELFKAIERERDERARAQRDRGELRWESERPEP